MIDLPAPLSAPDCDLRGYEFMPLFGDRLYGSRLYTLMLKNPRAGLAAQKLWWVAWQQCPAGSLADDDDELCRQADFGSSLKEWRRVKEIALYGFVKCSDGRLYHPILCIEAKSAYEKRKRERERKAAARAKRWNGDGNDSGIPEDVPRDNPKTGSGTYSETGVGHAATFRSDRTGQDRTEKKERDSSSAVPGLPPEVAPGVEAPSWPPAPLPSSITTLVGAATASLSDRARGQPFLTPPPPQRTPDEQIAAVGGRKRQSAGLSAAQLAEARRVAGVVS